MKKSQAIFILLFLFFISCNIKQQMKDILTEANQLPAGIAVIDSCFSTINTARFFPSLNSLDSVKGKGLEMKSLKNSSTLYSIKVLDENSIFHEIKMFKEGKSVTMMAIYKHSADSLINDTLLIRSKGMLNKRLLFEFDNRPKELYVLWQNYVLPASFITYGRKNLSVLVPKETRQQKQSYIRIFAADGNRIMIDKRVTLIFGIPLTEIN